MAHAVPVRDSKDRGGPMLAFTPDLWAGFVSALKDDELTP
ncbi:DUF397 domain-containing protein [Streptomyces avicenniae]